MSRFIIFLLIFFQWGLKGEALAPAESSFVEWESPSGLLKLERNANKPSLWKLLRYYEGQSRVGFCSVASSVIVLNRLGVTPPPSQFLRNYKIFTQEEFFSSSVSQVITREVVEKEGMTLEELAAVLKTFPLEVEKYKGRELSLNEMRKVMSSALKNSEEALLILFDRKTLDQVGTGHWSPLACYDEESDSFLILDVARFKYPPFWVKAKELLQAIQTPSKGGEERGFLVIKKREERSS